MTLYFVVAGPQIAYKVLSLSGVYEPVTPVVEDALVPQPLKAFVTVLVEFLEAGVPVPP